jgi:predicted nucleotide-binding protein (sugar kinase/HSP70/actin superfamily)
MFTESEQDLLARTYVIPYMCDHVHVLAAAMRAFGLRGEVIPISNESTAAQGGKVVLGRECLPCLLVVGDVLAYAGRPGFNPAAHALFITTSNGPCRFGQYQMIYRQILDEHGLAEMAIVGPNAENSYMGFGKRPGALRRLAWEGLIAVDLLQQALLHVRPYEVHPGESDRAYAASLEKVLARLRAGGHSLRDVLFDCAHAFDAIAVDRNRPRPVIGVTGEIYVRHNYFANRDLVRTLEALGAEVRLETVMGWGYYTNWHFAEMSNALGRPGAQLVMQASDLYQRWRERRLRGGMAHLLPAGPEGSCGDLVDAMQRYGTRALECESVITLGKAAEWAAEGIDGIVNVMPFSCMAGIIVSGLAVRLRRDYDNIPWLDLSFDQQRTTNLQTRLEAFMHQAEHRRARRMEAVAG